ncbi:MAG: hypothetical protein PHF46_01000 [Candidatus Gracilibacteria bacterium]|nr:hypothetical protein [Candidatus Gracilibacteria bacterium]MDD3119969.1 hypothetical protein [Candidatus Gracilibacteria bacterium]
MLEKIALESLFIIIGIFFLTVMQRIHFKILNKMQSSSKIISILGKTLFRIGVIIHEFSHLIFAILSFSKIKKINLFSKTGGSVQYSTPDYIGELPLYYDNSMYWIRLFLNQIGIFLISIGPLIVGIILNYFFVKNFLGIKGEFFDINEYLQVFSKDWLKASGFVIYTVFFIPSFILSFQDFSNFIIARQGNIGATVVGSFLNTTIFILFIAFLTNFITIFTSFFIFYIISFCVLLIFFVIYMILEKLINVP